MRKNPLLLLLVGVGIVPSGRGQESLGGLLAELKQAQGEVHYSKLTPEGERIEGGIYDPSVAYTPDGKVGWLAYTAIQGDYKPVGPYAHTHLARSTNSGASWQFVKVLNRSTNGTLILPGGGPLSGVWRYEVPTLALDPSDPDPGGRWKLFAHYYFWAPGRDRMVDYGWIVMRAAAGPAGDWSADVPLFGAGKSPAAPYHNTRVDLNALAPELKNTVAYSEPGALAHEGRLYLSMSALQPHLGVRGISVDHRVFLLVSEDHGKSWRFVSTLLTPDNGLALGCAGFDGSSLASEQGRFFLLAAPMVLQGKTEELDGTAAFEFESLEEGRLRRNLKHQPVVVAFFAPQPSIFSQFGAGQATYDPANTRGGLIMPQFNLGAYPQVFQIFNTGRRIVPVSQESERGARAYPEPAGRL